MGKGIQSTCCLTITVFVLLQTFVFQSQARQFNSNTTMKQCSYSPLAKSVDNFGSSLIQIIGGQGNLFLSPMSIYSALAMTYIGARGDTARQMEEAFKLQTDGLDKPKLNEAFQDYLTTIEAGNDKYSLLLANGIFLQKNYVVNKTYINNVQKHYHGIVKEEDFVSDGNTAKDDINNFVSQNTKKMIEKIFEEKLDPSTILVLVNAIYFKGIWKSQFPKEKTKNGIFYKNNGLSKTVNFMQLTKVEFLYFEDFNLHYQFLELPYEGGDISMLLALPRDCKKVPDLNMTADLLCSINGSFRRSEMENVMIPKFKLKYKKDLVDTLKKLGINDLFTGASNLTGISEKGNLKVSEVLHEAVIDVNEEGSEAAAVTAVVSTRMLAAVDPPKIVFIANHPFLFYIVDNRNGMLLFTGRASDP